jgi:hypothetical protein
MMRYRREYVPVRIDNRAVTVTEAPQVEPALVVGILFWMSLTALAVISFAL